MAPGWLARLGLRTPEQRAWAMYDWANSAFQCTIITAVFPIYFAKVAAEDLPDASATALFAAATTVALTLIAIVSPILGAYADYAGVKKKLLGVFLGIGVVTTAAMFFIGPGDWKLAALLFVISNIAISGSFVFYDSLLPHVAGSDEMDRVSSAGYALGYLGGGLLLAINLAWILKPELFGLRDSSLASRSRSLSASFARSATRF
jgi:MFS transporter, UMF1 family